MPSRFLPPLPPQNSESSVQGYHGTCLESAQQILNDDGFRIIGGENSFLGPGAYFYEGSYSAALSWAKMVFSDNHCVLSAMIELGCCIDLLEPAVCKKIIEIKERISRPEFPVELPTVLAWISKNYSVDTIRALRHETTELFSGSPFAFGGMVVICVVNPKKISSIYLCFQ